MVTYAELEIGLHRRHSDGYAVELRLTDPENEAEDQLPRSGVALFDFDKLRSLSMDPEQYGRELGRSLFADPEVRARFVLARSLEIPLRARLFVGPSAPELHELLWETIRDPEDGFPLATAANFLFYRYLSSVDWRRVRPRPKHELTSLVAIANPTKGVGKEQGQYPLDPVDVEKEFALAAEGLGSIPVRRLPNRATLDNLIAHLRDAPPGQTPEILYLVCHGARTASGPVIFLEGPDGEVVVVAAETLATQLRALPQPPRLVVLASCQSAGGDAAAADINRGALAALGPRLAEVGIPAVLAMQGKVAMSTVQAFMPTFFAQLQEHGQLDLAMSVARNAIRERPDSWMPVLFMRLRSGRLWYQPGFAGEKPGDFGRWPALLGNIANGRCTVIIGSGFLESLVGSPRDMAQRLAESYGVPLAAHDRQNLVQVAQYLAVDQDPNLARDELVGSLRRELLGRYGNDLAAGLQEAPLAELMERVGAGLQERDPTDPHSILARLPFPLYVSTNQDSLLVAALKAANRPPHVEMFDWRRNPEPPPPRDGQATGNGDLGAGERPSKERPWVYYLLGHVDDPESMVLTEDNYFDYLIGATSNRHLIPGAIRRALVNTALLFLGFQLDDWDFRVLFRSIMRQEGAELLASKGYAHVAVQIEPEEGRIQDTARARQYLERYFQRAGIGANINIFWGSASDFMIALAEKWDEKYPRDTAATGDGPQAAP